MTQLKGDLNNFIVITLYQQLHISLLSIQVDKYEKVYPKLLGLSAAVIIFCHLRNVRLKYKYYY